MTKHAFRRSISATSRTLRSSSRPGRGAILIPSPTPARVLAFPVLGGYACGCETGAAFVLVGVAAQLGAALLEPGPIRWPTLVETGLFALVLFALGLIGKIFGLVVAEWRLRQKIAEAVRKLGRVVP